MPAQRHCCQLVGSGLQLHDQLDVSSVPHRCAVGWLDSMRPKGSKLSRRTSRPSSPTARVALRDNLVGLQSPVAFCESLQSEFLRQPTVSPDAHLPRADRLPRDGARRSFDAAAVRPVDSAHRQVGAWTSFEADRLASSVAASHRAFPRMSDDARVCSTQQKVSTPAFDL